MTVENHYVLIIHGTFNAPSPNQTKWYQPADPAGNFCSRLQERLTRLLPEMQGAVWRRFDAKTSFRWSGDNDHRERLRAAYHLYDTFKQIIKADPKARIHVVAHSHGGNVLLRAVEILLSPSPESRREIHMRDLWQWYFRRYPRLLRWFSLDRADPIVGRFEEDSFREGAAHLGRLVFLGTPFVRKQWTPPVSFGRRLLARLAGNLPAALTGTAVTVYPMAIVASAVAASTPWCSFIGVNPLRWPPAWQWLVGAGVFLYAVVILFEEARFNSNLYFAEHRHKRVPPARFPALVVSARLLDEALLALSTEPLVATELAPRIEELFHPERSWPLHRLFALLRARRKQDGPVGPEDPWVEDIEIGRYWASFSVFKRVPLWMAKLVFDCVYFATFYLWSALQKGVNRLVLHLIRDSLAAASLGVPGGELRGARLEISPHISVDEVFAEEFWDVSEIALQAPIVVPTTTADSKRYAYLLDAAALSVRLKAEEGRGDRAWLRLRDNLGALYGRYASSFVFEADVAGRVSRVDYDSAMARIWLTIVERIREVSGSIELAHSAYYANPEVEDAIANFIATGSRLGNSRAAVSEYIWEGNPNYWD